MKYRVSQGEGGVAKAQVLGLLVSLNSHKVTFMRENDEEEMVIYRSPSLTSTSLGFSSCQKQLK